MFRHSVFFYQIAKQFFASAYLLLLVIDSLGILRNY